MDKDANLSNGEEQQHFQEDAAKIILNRMRKKALLVDQPKQSSRLQKKQVEKFTTERKIIRASLGSGRDPQGLATIVQRMISDRGWSSPVAVGSVISQWKNIVGADIASHCHPESFQHTVLQVRCDSTTWATQLRLLAPQLIKTIDAQLGEGIVRKLEVFGPVTVNWAKGKRRVAGRGPRDTYG